MFNLISNAIKYSPEGKPIEITSEYSEGKVKFFVKDFGIGITDKDQQHLFERFFRGHNVTHIQGTGLGLNIVSKYIELMKGTENIESKENKATTIMITIPQ